MIRPFHLCYTFRANLFTTMKKKKFKKMDKKIERMFRASEVGALIEHLEGKFDAVAEGQTILQEELREFKDETAINFKKLFEFKDETAINFKKLFEFRDETKSNFKTVFEYFSNLDEEIKDIKKRLEHLEEGNMDEGNRISLMERVRNLEKEVKQFRAVLKLKKA